MSISYSLCFADSSIASDLIVWYSPIPGSILLSANVVYSSVIVHLRDLVTCCTTLMCSHRVGPEYHICHADEQIPLLVTLLYAPLRRTQETPFQSPVTWWQLMQLKFKDWAAHFFILQREHHDTIVLQLILWVMSIMALSTSGMISSSIGVMHHDQETSIISWSMNQ
jgi:hypothetical protein